jgi:hypothetical protein
VIQPVSEQLREDSIEALQAKVERYKDLWDFGFEEMREEYPRGDESFRRMVEE